LTTILLEKAYELAAPIADAVRAERPDFVVYDSMCPWGRIAADLVGVTAVASMSLIQLPPPYLIKSGQIGTILRLAPRLMQWAGRYRKASRLLEERYGIELPGPDRVINWPGAVTISYTTADIYAEAEQLGSQFIFIGPSIGFGMPEVAFPFEELDSERPLIYASLGTVFNHNVDFFKDCIWAFGDSEYQVVMSLGKGLPLSELGGNTGQFYCARLRTPTSHIRTGKFVHYPRRSEQRSPGIIFRRAVGHGSTASRAWHGWGAAGRDGGWGTAAKDIGRWNEKSC
jgi:MGT family glycosyltransferase